MGFARRAFPGVRADLQAPVLPVNYPLREVPVIRGTIFAEAHAVSHVALYLPRTQVVDHVDPTIPT